MFCVNLKKPYILQKPYLHSKKFIFNILYITSFMLHSTSIKISIVILKVVSKLQVILTL